MSKYFTPDVIARFTFLEEQHPAPFVLYRAELYNMPVSVMMLFDIDKQTMRPMAIILSDELMTRLKIEGAEIVKDEPEEDEES